MLEDNDNLIASARNYFANDFPNLSRAGCVSRAVLAELIDSKRLPDASLRAHLLGCSECFEYFNKRLTSAPVEVARPSVWEKFMAAMTGGRQPLIAALLIIACLAVGAIWLYLSGPAREATPSISRSAEELAAGVELPTLRPDVPATPTPPEPSGTQISNAPSTGNQKPAKRKPPVLASTLVKIDLSGRLILRGEADGGKEGPIRVLPERNRLSVKLSEGSPAGEYTVSLADALGGTVTVRKARSPDGKNLVLLLDMRTLASKNYRLCVSYAGGAPSCVPLSVTRRR